LVETFREEKKAFGHVVIPEYQVLLEDMPFFQRLFQYRYLENVSNLSELCNLVGCRDVEEIVDAERKLDAYFRRVMGGNVRGDLLELVCPNCLQLSLSGYGKDGEGIRRTCHSCGMEATDAIANIDDFNQDLDRDLTYAPTSKLSYSKGLGGSFDPNKNRDQKHFLWQALNANNVLFSEFKLEHPDITKELEGAYQVWCGDYVYCRMGDFVRRAHINEKFAADQAFWHQFDAPLKNKKLRMEIKVKSDVKRACEYGLKLCERYGFNRKDRDQPIFNTVGHGIRLMKQQLKDQKHRVPEKRFVETIFYICLLKLGKRGVAVKAKSELDIDFWLVNYYVDYEEFRIKHDNLNGTPAVLNAIEQAALAQKIA
jgi:hypothetical protein